MKQIYNAHKYLFTACMTSTSNSLALIRVCFCNWDPVWYKDGKTTQAVNTTPHITVEEIEQGVAGKFGGDKVGRDSPSDKLGISI